MEETTCMKSLFDLHRDGWWIKVSPLAKKEPECWVCSIYKKGKFFAVNDVNLHINKEQVVGVVGESGCGKSVMALSILNLIDYPGRIHSGKIIYRKDRERIEITNLNKMGQKNVKILQIRN